MNDRTQLVRLGLVGILLAATALRGENWIRVDSAGIHYVIDADSDAVQPYLKPADPQAGAIKVPKWLYPAPGAMPTESSYNVRYGIAVAAFASGSTREELAAYYLQLLQSHGYRSNSRELGETGTVLVVGGKLNTGTPSVHVTPRQGFTELRVEYSFWGGNAPKKFSKVWYDDPSGVLCLREVATGEYFYLDKQFIVQASRIFGAGVAWGGLPMPAWLPVYPGAQRISDKAESLGPAAFVTPDSIRAVTDYYTAAVKNAGAKVLSSQVAPVGGKDYQGHVLAVLGDDQMEIFVQEMQFLIRRSASKDVGIVIRYIVPKP
jgi:hypothetical protein